MDLVTAIALHIYKYWSKLGSVKKRVDDAVGDIFDGSFGRKLDCGRKKPCHIPTTASFSLCYFRPEKISAFQLINLNFLFALFSRSNLKLIRKI